MFDHVTLRVKDLEVSKRFYLQLLAPLGYKLLRDGTSVGFGAKDEDGSRDFWLKQGKVEGTPSFSCFAFRAPTKESVNEFHSSGLKAGGIDNGAPGYRPKYHRGYWAAFVLDPNGYNIEAFYHDVDSKE